MEQCNACFCATTNGQFIDANCPQQDCFKYCLPVNNNSLAGYDIRTMTADECNTVFANNAESKQRCLAVAPIPGSSADPNAPTPEEQQAQLQTKNNKVLLVAAIIIIAILIATLIYTL